MSIKKSFNGKTIRKPGAYSKSSVDNSAGAPLRATDVLFIVGEAALGAPGAVAGIQEFPAERLNELVATYGEGPLVDCAVAAARPSKQQGIGGASIIKVWKTNASTQAAAILDALIQIKDRAWGAAGNDLSVVVTAGSAAGKKSIQIAKVGSTTEILGENAAQNILSIKYNGADATATVTIAGTSRANLTLTTSTGLSILLKNHTMKTLVDYINAQADHAAVLMTPSAAPRKANDLDPVVNGDIKTAPLTMKRIQSEIVDLINGSERVEAALTATPAAGTISNAQTFLSGGAKGASANSNFSAGMAQSLAEDYNVLLPAVSRDASEDIQDEKQGWTDPTSSYTIAAVLTAADTHLRLRGDTKNRKEAQGFGGVRKAAKADAFAAIATVGSELMQVTMQDALILDAAGDLRYMHPHVVAALAAGMRTGMEVGEPLTHKYPNVLQVGHMIDPETGLETGDFNAGLDADAAIDAGVLFLEKASGGNRWVVDNTTYGIDDSFVYNRGSVMAASQFVFKTLRETAELAFVGKKVSSGAASSIKNVIRNKLRELNAPDVNIITASADAPEGFREDTFVVTVEGNTAKVQVEFKPVQGLDFVLFSFTLGDIKQTA